MPRILIVEDDYHSRFLISQILQKIGYEVQEADNGLSALDCLLKDSSFDLIMSDVRMARMDGLSLLAELKRLYPDIPVMMLSVHSRSEWALEALNRGASAFLQKPFTRDQLVQAVSDLAPLDVSTQ